MFTLTVILALPADDPEDSVYTVEVRLNGAYIGEAALNQEGIDALAEKSGQCLVIKLEKEG